MIATIPCESNNGDCPYLKTCIARLTDRTITGCGMALYINGVIKYEDIGVNHSVLVNKKEIES